MELSNDTVFWIATGSYVIMLTLFAIALRSKEKQNVQLRADVYKFKNIADQREVVYGQMAEKAAKLERLSRERGQQVDNMVEQCRVMGLRNEGLAEERDAAHDEIVKLRDTLFGLSPLNLVTFHVTGGNKQMFSLNKREPVALTVSIRRQPGEGYATVTLRQLAYSKKNVATLNAIMDEANDLLKAAKPEPDPAPNNPE